jgi:DNA-directed RNA polymerase subunit L
MRSVMIKGWLTAALVLSAAGLALGQQPSGGPPSKEAADKEKHKLEELLAKALKDNPDVRVAEAKVREAEAELNRARLLVAQKVTAFAAAHDAARKGVEEAEAKLKRMAELGRQKVVSIEELREAEAVLARAKAELAKVEAEMPYLLGKQAGGASATDLSNTQFFLDQLQRSGDLSSSSTTDAAVARGLYWLAVHQAGGASGAGTVPAKIRQTLDQPISVDFKNAPFADLVHDLQEKTGISFRNHVSDRYKDGNPNMTLKLHDLPLRAVLQAIQDDFPGDNMTPLGGLRFVVREYGILVTYQNKMPPGAILATDFRDLESGFDPFKTTTKSTAPNVEGMIKEVDDKNEFVTISIGSDAGLAKGQTLDVYRLNPKPTYLGTVTILDAHPTESVGKPQTKEKLQAGDKVAGNILGKNR